MTGANSLDALTAGALAVWRLAAEAAGHAAASRIEPVHLLIGVCRFCAGEPGGSPPAPVDGEARGEADALRLRFAGAEVDPAAYARRLARWVGRATRVAGTERTDVTLGPAARAVFTRAGAAVQAVTPGGRTGAADVLHDLLAHPAPAWVELLADLAGPAALERLRPAVDADRTGTVAQVRLDVRDRHAPVREVWFTGPVRWLVGRSASADLRLLDKGVSRQHCLLEVDPPHALVRDLGSLSGTFVGDRKVDVHELVDGDRIRIGGATIDLVVVEPSCPGCGGPSAAGGLCVRCTPPAPPRRGDGRAPGSGGTRVLVACVVCTEPADRGAGADRVCEACAGDPDRLVRALGERVDAGQQVPGLFGGYTVDGLLGTGGMGAVYAATDERTGLRVALKLMLPHGVEDEQAEQRFVREARLAEVLRHRNVVRQRESGRWNGVFYIVTDLCEGGSVLSLLQRSGGTLEVRRAVLIAAQALAGLAHAHSIAVPVRLRGGGIVVATGLVHRDISPGNLLFSRGVVKLADFGLAKAFETAGHSGVTPTGVAGGKARFVPRQQVTGFRQARPEVDVWATAACLYYMLTGAYPRDFGEPQYEWAVVMGTSPVAIRERDPHLPAALAEVIDRALVDDPVIGIGDAAQLRAALLDAL